MLNKDTHSWTISGNKLVINNVLFDYINIDKNRYFPMSC